MVWANAVFQDRRTGKRVRRIGASVADGSVLVKGQDNVPYYASLSELMPCDAQGVPDRSVNLVPEEQREDPLPDPIIDIPENRLNVNLATAEEIARRVPGVGYRVAKAIKQQQLTMPGEVYRNLDQLRNVSKRINWDQVLESNTLFIG